MKASIIVEPVAREQILTIDTWWRAHRPAAQDAFRDEIVAALMMLEEAPDVGPLYAASPVPGVRRVQLKKTRHHVYYVHDRDSGVVHVLAVWSASRGQPPQL